MLLSWAFQDHDELKDSVNEAEISIVRMLVLLSPMSTFHVSLKVCVMIQELLKNLVMVIIINLYKIRFQFDYIFW